MWAATAEKPDFLYVPSPATRPRAPVPGCRACNGKYVHTPKLAVKQRGCTANESARGKISNSKLPVQYQHNVNARLDNKKKGYRAGHWKGVKYEWRDGKGAGGAHNANRLFRIPPLPARNAPCATKATVATPAHCDVGARFMVHDRHVAPMSTRSCAPMWPQRF